MEQVGFCSDKDGTVRALLTDGEKYYRENPSKIKHYLLAIRSLKTDKQIIQSFPDEEARSLMIHLLDIDDHPFWWSTAEIMDVPQAYPIIDISEIL